jgi:hypothetical protein
MAADLYFENVATKKRYKVVKLDQEAGTITLVGPHGVEFTDTYSKERFAQMGYRPVMADAPPPPPAGAAPPPPAAVVVAG